MSKKLLFTFLVVIGLFYIFNIDRLITNKITTFNNLLKQIYIETIISSGSFISRHFEQEKTIEELQQQNLNSIKFKTLYKSSSSKLNNILDKISSLNPYTEDVKLIKVLSYVDFSDPTRVWLDLDKNNSKIEGLILDEYSAGIVITKDNKPMGLLNGNSKCNYAVFIGDSKAPGITHGSKNKRDLIAKYIPIWMKINIGDEVVTSGMDDIFFEGLKVGTVIKIDKKADTQEATIKPYANVLNQRYFYLYSHKPASIKRKTGSTRRP